MDMMMNAKKLFLGGLLWGMCAAVSVAAPATDEGNIVLPTKAQADWQRKECIMFVHYGPAAFQGREYDNWSSDIRKMYMSKLNTDQWCEVARSWGAKMIIFVAKHCGGFCWWQTDTSDYGVKNTPWRNGEGDVMKELSASCKKYGLDMGVYVYPGDEHWGAGIGSGGVTKDPSKQEAYNKIYRQQLEELLSGYGTMKEVWFDGNCHIPVKDILDKYASEAVIFQGKYATIRWVGNEDGFAPDPNWYTVNKKDMQSGGATAVHSAVNGDVYAPVEVDVPFLKNGGHKWFWSAGSDSLLMSRKQLMELYFNSVGRGSVLLLNATPDTTGLIPTSHVQRYKDFGETIRRYFDNPLAKTAGKSTQLQCTLDASADVNCIMLQEDLMKGQRITSYQIEASLDGNKWEVLCKGTSVGNKKIDRFATRKVKSVRLVVNRSKATPCVENFSVFCLPEEAIQTVSSEDAPVTVSAWEYTTYSPDEWTDVTLDLTPYMNSIGQYELVFRTTGYDYQDNRPSGLEVADVQLEMYGSAMNAALQEVKSQNKFIITRSQQTLDDFPIVIRMKVKRRPCKSIGVISLRKIKY